MSGPSPPRNFFICVGYTFHIFFALECIRFIGFDALCPSVFRAVAWITLSCGWTATRKEKISVLRLPSWMYLSLVSSYLWVTFFIASHSVFLYILTGDQRSPASYETAKTSQRTGRCVCACVCWCFFFTTLIPYFPLLAFCDWCHPSLFSSSFVLFFLGNFLPSSLPSKTILRAKFSSITAPAILHAFNHLTLPNYNEARSVDARQEVDLRIGCSFTRFQTTLFQVGNQDLVAQSTIHSKMMPWKNFGKLLELGIWWASRDINEQ